MKTKTQKTEFFLIASLFLLILGYAVLVGAQAEDGLTPMGEDVGALGGDDSFTDSSNQNVDMITKQLSDLEAISFDEKVAQELFGREDYQSLIKFDYGINPPDLGRDNPFLPVTK